MFVEEGFRDQSFWRAEAAGTARKGAQKQKNLRGQTAPPSPRLSITAEVHSTASQTSSWPAVMCELGDRDQGSRRWPEQLQGKMVNHVYLHGPHKGTSPLYALSSLQNILCCFPLLKFPLIPRPGNSAVRRTPWRDVLSPVGVTSSLGRRYPGQLCMSTNWEHAKSVLSRETREVFHS